MREALRFLGWAGLVLFLFGIVSYALTGTFDLWTAVHVAGGGILLAAGIGSNLAGFRRSVAARGTRERAQAGVGALLFLAIVVVANAAAARHPWRWDLTENRIHTLSEQSRAIVRGLPGPVELLAFAGPAEEGRDDLAALLDRFRAESPKLSWRFVDPEREPQLAARHGVRRQGVLVAVAGASTAQTGGDPGSGITEGAVANLLVQVSRPGPTVVDVLVGHGESAPDDRETPGGLGALADALGEENFTVRPLLLSTAAAVPADTRILVVAGPRKPLLPHEVEQVEAFLGRGGRALVLLDPGPDAGLAPVLSRRGIAPADDTLVDQEEVPFLGARLGLNPVIEEFPAHPITREFRERIVLLQARSLDVSAPAAVLAESRPSSWGERAWTAMMETGRVSRDPDDEEGPLPVAAAWSEGQARLVAVGDSDLAVNGNLDAYFNREFLLNAAHWLAGTEEMIAERPRGLRPSRLDMTEADYRTLFRLGVLLLPEALLILGLGIWWRRRTL